MRRPPLALLLVAALGCSKPAPVLDDSAPLPGAPPPRPPPSAAPAAAPLPMTASGALARYVDGGVLDNLTAALSRGGISYCGQALFAGVSARGADAPRAGADGYIASCQRLPVPAQRCLGLLYSGAHDAECTRLRDSLDAPTRAEFERLQRARSAVQ